MTASTLGSILLAALVLVIGLFAWLAARSERPWRNRANESGTVDPGVYLWTGLSDSSGCDGGSSGGGDC